MSDFLFDTPWWLLVLLIGGGIAVWYVGNTRLDATLKWAGVGAFLAGVTLALVSHFVETAKEQVTRKTRELVTSVADRNWDQFSSLLDARTSFAGAYNNREQIVNGAKKTTDMIGLKGATITSTDVTQTDTLINVDLSILSEQDATLGRPMPTNWRFDWQDTGTGWKLTEIEPLDGGQVKKSEIMGRLAR